jgi:hypothetical protein
MVGFSWVAVAQGAMVAILQHDRGFLIFWRDRLQSNLPPVG